MKLFEQQDHNKKCLYGLQLVQYTCITQNKEGNITIQHHATIKFVDSQNISRPQFKPAQLKEIKNNSFIQKFKQNNS